MMGDFKFIKKKKKVAMGAKALPTSMGEWEEKFIFAHRGDNLYFTKGSLMTYSSFGWVPNCR